MSNPKKTVAPEGIDTYRFLEQVQEILETTETAESAQAACNWMKQQVDTYTQANLTVKCIRSGHMATRCDEERRTNG